jgi:putative intracellular protease/amidase
MKTQEVYLFVFDGLSDWEAAFAIAGINSPTFQKAPGRYRITTVGLSRATVITVGGLRVQPDQALDKIACADREMLILPGGTPWDEGKNMEAVEVAKSLLNAGGSVAAICGATAGLARGGVLDDRSHTSNAREYLAATQYRGAAHYQDAPAVSDGNLITASATAPVDFAAHIFRRLDLYSEQVHEAWYGHSFPNEV